LPFILPLTNVPSKSYLLIASFSWHGADLIKYSSFLIVSSGGPWQYFGKGPYIRGANKTMLDLRLF